MIDNKHAKAALEGGKMVRDALLGLGFREADLAKPADLTPRCRNPRCKAEVGDGTIYCTKCRDEMRAESRAFALRHAYASMPKWPWARFGDARFQAATTLAGDVLTKSKAWQPAQGQLVLIGPTGVGKTACACAIGFALLDHARDNHVTQEVLDQAAGLRFAHAGDLARARRNHPLGHGDPPDLVEAMEATILILDELGREPAGDSTIFELLDYRYRHDLPSVITARLTRAEMKLPERYGPDGARRMLELGEVGEWRKAGVA